MKHVGRLNYISAHKAKNILIKHGFIIQYFDNGEWSENNRAKGSDFSTMGDVQIKMIKDNQYAIIGLFEYGGSPILIDGFLDENIIIELKTK